MNSWIVRICSAAGEVSAEAKLYLALLRRQHGDMLVRGVDETVVKRLGISQRVAARVVAELVAAEHLKPAPMPSTGKPGRPAVIYTVQPEIMEPGLINGTTLWQGKEAGSHFELLIEGLLTEPSAWSGERAKPGQMPSREGAAKRLSASNRLLLAVLLGLANRNGVVRGWGLSSLAKLVGLSQVSHEGQVGKLLRLGYLRTVIPGVSGRRLFGTKPGVFFLSLSHPSYNGSIPEVLLLYPVESLEHIERGQGEARALYRYLQVFRQRPRAVDWNAYYGKLLQAAGFVDMVELRSLAYLFDGVGTSTLADYLQVTVEQYASRLMPYSHTDHDAALHSLREVIDHELWPKGDRGRADSRENLVRLILFLADRLARLIGNALSNTPDLTGRQGGEVLDKMSYAIVPAITGSRGSYFAISAMPAEASNRSPRYLVLECERNSFVTRLSGGMLSDAESCDYGLITRGRMSREAPERIKEVREHLRMLAIRKLAE